MSSLVGAVFGAFALALAIPIVQPLVLSIGSSEFFMLALLGITFVASLSGGNMLKGLCTGAFGLVLATIGLDPIESVPRFTLDPLIGEDAALFLWDGLSLVSVTVGLFAIPEIIDLSVQGTSIARQSTGKLGGVMQGVIDTFRHWKLVLACSAIGSYIGLIPGLGGGPAQWWPMRTRCRARRETRADSARAPLKVSSAQARPTTPRRAARWFRLSRSASRAAFPWPSCWGPSSSRASFRGRTCSIRPST